MGGGGGGLGGSFGGLGGGGVEGFDSALGLALILKFRNEIND